MDDESLIDVHGLKIVETTLGTIDLLVQRRLLSQAKYRIYITPPFGLGESPPRHIS